MPLLYRALRRGLRLGLELYYVDIRATGREHIPEDGPVIFAANHPNSVMDSVILGTQTSRSIHYLARSGLFANPLVAAVFHACGVIPIFRRQDATAHEEATVSRNDDTFRAAFEVLERAGTIGIFPEGRNAPERHVRDIKTGTARIALGAEAKNDFELGVRVVPVGLNFEDRDRWLTRVLVRFGPAIDARDFEAAWNADDREAVRAMTDRIQDGIRREALHVEDVRHTELVRDVHGLYGAEVLKELIGRTPDVRGLRRRLFDGARGVAAAREDLDDWFTVKQAIADAVKLFERERPDVVARFRRNIRRYKDHLEQASLRRDFLDRPPKTLSIRREALKMTLYAVLLAPVALWGLLHNFIPSRITRRAAMRAPDEAMRAITVLLTGGLAFGLFYAAYGAAVFAASGSWPWVAAYLASLPLAGFWWVRWRRQLARYSNRIVVRDVFRTNRAQLRRLALEREQLVMELDQLRREYVARRGGA
jgi:1-acyl-sn-glycerol-3-phosphate acyltransferase